ncbi:GNAT family N-acetyltransferase [Sphingomonas japonica]|uniref:Ribosomal-protein-alanine N-acetyltransferase n=1 Tax=Sphingomonas japonica TaxID=511662 RepID=A0ABX0TZR1_9SPHN|nr:GNAT family N-acetyltransferase [Sphingomonas japonica]NIJ22662.1 ribosomal-protein-alanine N-acetyltransferase [Sphingomonas japonica]
MSTLASMVDLRSGGPPDLPAIAALMTAAFDPRFGEAWTQAQCMGILSLPGVWLTIARQNGADVGFALARSTYEDAELLLLATHPHARRSGVGRSLLRSVIADAADRGATRLLLEVRADNEAIALYRREQFSKIGERLEYYRGAHGRSYDAHTYFRPLPQAGST